MAMKYRELDQTILDYANVQRVFPFEKDMTVYQVAQDDDEPQMFALIEKNSQPLRVTLKIDALLAQNLRTRYEEVQGAANLNQKYWITVVNTGQMTDDEIYDLVRLAYNLASR